MIAHHGLCILFSVYGVYEEGKKQQQQKHEAQRVYLSTSLWNETHVDSDRTINTNLVEDV